MQRHGAKGSKKIRSKRGRSRKGKERKNMLLSIDILPNTSNYCIRSLGVSTVCDQSVYINGLIEGRLTNRNASLPPVRGQTVLGKMSGLSSRLFLGFSFLIFLLLPDALV